VLLRKVSKSRRSRSASFSCKILIKTVDDFTDVVRTDRANPYFAGEGNANIEVMKNILLNYAYNNPSMR